MTIQDKNSGAVAAGADPSVEFSWEISSDWAALDGVPYSVECLAAHVSIPAGQEREKYVSVAGDTLSRTVLNRCTVSDMWLMFASANSFSVSSKVQIYKYHKMSISQVLADYKIDFSHTVKVEFDVLEQGGMYVRRGAAVKINSDEWGKAGEVMLRMLAVGVAFKVSPSEAELASLGQAVLRGDSPGASVPVGARLSHLTRLLIDEVDICDGVLTLYGEFDDHESVMEFHRPFIQGIGPLLREDVE